MVDLGPRLAAVVTLVGLVLSPSNATRATACVQPGEWNVAAAFDLAANGVATAGQPAPIAIPPSLLKAIGWVESNWRQSNVRGLPLVSSDFGYGVMQITSGMAGAFGNSTGSIPPDVQSRIASDYAFNIAYGARVLAEKWGATPRIGDGNPAALEDWYYAVWAYNGWGWVNNPNNPRFSRRGTPATDPATWPYQQRVFYLVAHPPKDAQGNPLWQPVPVSLPSRQTIGTRPVSYTPIHTHTQQPGSLSAVYFSGRLRTIAPGGKLTVHVHVENTGTEPWPAVGSNAVMLTYHLLSAFANPYRALGPYAPGVVAYGQNPVTLRKDLLPGETATLAETLHAPAVAGRYRIAWDLEQAPGTWFSQIDSLPRAFPWTIGTGGATPTPPPTPTLTATPGPARGMRYVADTGTPDGTRVAAGEAFEKGWLVYNPGKTPWTSSWHLVQVGGKAMGPKSLAMPPALPCTSANVLVSLLAPPKAGTYRSVWRLRAPSGMYVGDRLTVVIRSAAGNPGGTPGPSPTPTPTRHGPTPTPTPAG